MGGGTNEEAVTGNGRRGHAHFAQTVFPQQFVFWTGLNDIRVAIFAQAKNLVIVRPRGRRETSRAFQVDSLLLIHLPTRPGVATIEKPEIEQDIKQIFINQR